MIQDLTEAGWNFPEGPSPISYTNFDGIDCDALLIHDYLKYVKFGYGRATDAACRDIRLGIIDRQEGIRLVRRYDGRVPFIARRRFINYLGLTDEEYESILDSHTNKELFVLDRSGKPAKDSDGSLIPEFQI